MRIVFLGTFDLSKPRTRILRDCLRAIDPELQEIGFDVWKGVGDKSMLKGPLAKAVIVFRLLAAYPVLLTRYAFASRHDVVVIGYMGLFDVLALASFAKLRGKRVVWDAFLSIYDTYARDRGMGREKGIFARLLKGLEHLACRFANVVVLDTKAHAAMMGRLHAIAPGKLASVLVGAESDAFNGTRAASQKPANSRVKVLFYGQFIPLHGIDTIVDAALLPGGSAFDWTIVGTGQESAEIDARLKAAGAAHIERIDWIEYEELQLAIGAADVTLGIFGTSEKASSVIPNKVFQALLSGKPIVTQDSPGIREIVSDDTPGIYLVPPGDPQALIAALQRFSEERASLPSELHGEICEAFAFPLLVEDWRGLLEEAISVDGKVQP